MNSEVTAERRSTTVAFELDALRRVRDPSAAFAQTAGWARSVGLVSDRPTHVVTAAARDWGVDYSFTSGPRNLLESLVAIRSQPEHEADRYLLIATEAVEPDPVRMRGWAYLPIEEAADAGGWTIHPTDEDIGNDEDSRGWP